MRKVNFALVGVAGYIAERHVRAIKDTNNELIATLDNFDSVGFLDSYFPNADFFHEFERFERHVDKLSRTDKKIDYVSICSPNYLHDSHIRFALRHKANAICEKPLVLNPWNVDALESIEKETGNKIFNILQLRLHPSIIELKQKVEQAPKDKIYDIDLAYITSRGKWYHYSWKGNSEKSGGVATNIGVHFFDMLTWIFGDVKKNDVHFASQDTVSGYLELERARVRWALSIDETLLPDYCKENGQRTYRSIKMENQEIEFSAGFTDLHTVSYQNILNGNGFGLQAAKKSIEIVYNIRNASPIGLKGDYHPIMRNII
jgi:UDP-N-acetyl-2-amino-2-deoxyglucuronate dehydrogenase